MKRILVSAAVLFSATAAQAHNGIHLHPHGAEGWLGAMTGFSIIAIAAVAWKVRK